MQKIGDQLEHFSILNDFWKFEKNLKNEMEQMHESGREKEKMQCSLKKWIRPDSNQGHI